MKVSFPAVVLLCAGSVAPEKLRGTKKTIYKGKVNVVPARPGRNLEGEVPTPPPLDVVRQGDPEGRTLFEGGPEVVHNMNTGPIVGTVFNDANMNGVQDEGESGIEGVMVSDGLNVVMTNSNGAYELPSPTEEASEAGFSVFITKPAGYNVPVNDAMVSLLFLLFVG